MSLYLLINILTILIPLMLSFENKLKFYKNITHVIFSIIIVGIPLLVWDAAATSRGDWSFNPSYNIGLKIAGLPLEEIIFFVTVPYAVIFLYDTYLYYISKSKREINYAVFILPCMLSIAASFIFRDKYYTFTVFLFLSILFLLLSITKPIFLKQRYIGLFLLFTFIPFGIENYFLTSLPVVLYKENVIWGIRIIAIPLEDFFYSFLLITSYIYFYELSKEKWKRKIVL